MTAIRQALHQFPDLRRLLYCWFRSNRGALRFFGMSWLRYGQFTGCVDSKCAQCVDLK
jgi:hypothetical protein